MCVMLTLSRLTLSKNNKQVLSAAYCLGVLPNVVTLVMHKIKLGTGEAAKFCNIECIPILQALVHPKYNKSKLDYDILLIQLN